MNKPNSLKHCKNSSDLKNPTATPIIPSQCPFQLRFRDSKVVHEDISLSCGAAKLQIPDLIQDETHTTDSHHTTESHFLKNLCLETPIAWGNSTDERWTELDDKVSINLHMCPALAETVSPFQETIYTKATNIFGPLQLKARCLAGQT